MAKITITIGTEKQTRYFPETMRDLSLQKFLSLDAAYASGDSVKVIAAWLDVTAEEVNLIPAKYLNQITSLISWYDNETVHFITSQKYESVLFFEGKKYELPNANDFEDRITLAQFLKFDDLAKKHGVYIAACAVVVSPFILSGGKWDESMIDSYILQACMIPAHLGFPIASFFLQCRRKRMPQSTPLNSPNTRKQMRLAWIILTSTVLLISLTAWLAVILLSGTR